MFQLFSDMYTLRRLNCVKFCVNIAKHKIRLQLTLHNYLKIEQTSLIDSVFVEQIAI